MRGVYLIAGAGVLSACLAGWAALAVLAQPGPATLPASAGSAASAKEGPGPGLMLPATTGPAAPGLLTSAPLRAPMPGGSTTSPLPAGPSAIIPAPAVSGPGPSPLGTSLGAPVGPPTGLGAPEGPSAAAEEASAPVPEGTVGRQEPAVSMEWVGPLTAKVGQPGDYTLVLRNVCTMPVQNVLVRVRVPRGMTVVATEPPAKADGGMLNWELGSLLAKQDRALQIKLTAESKGDRTPQAWVTFTGTTAMRLKVREPKLAVKILPPEKMLVGDPAQFTLAVTNPGDGSADQVKIQAVLSDGLEHPRGNRIHFEIGNLAAGETRNIALLCATRTGGVQKCEVLAEAEGGLKAGDVATINVIMPRLDLQVSGPGLRYLDRKALYTLKVTNPGDAPATNVTVADTVPAGFKVLAASDGGRHDFQTRTVSWFLGEIGPGQVREVKLEVQAISPGEHKHKATAVGARGLRAESELLTRVEGLSAMLVELVDLEDPIEVNGDTAYEVRITNTGSKTETDIKLVATVPDKMQFKSARFQAEPARFREEGKTIVFEPIAKLAPHADAIFRINVKALDAGTAYFKIQLTSTNLTEPVIKTEATRIYADQAEPAAPAVGPAPMPAGGPAAPVGPAPTMPGGPESGPAPTMPSGPLSGPPASPTGR